jgi:tetratricopeptide (TPR) repeat protein
LLAAVLVLTAVAGAWANQDPSVLAEFDVHNDGDWLIIPVTVHGKTYPFVVDTGCVYSVLDISLLHGDPVETIDLKKSIMKLYKAPTMNLGNIAWNPTGLVEGFDLSLMRDVSGHKFYGLVGMDFLANYVVQIDFDRGKLRLLDSSLPGTGKRIPIFFPDNKKARPLVICDIAGWGPEAHLIDTGDIHFGALRKELFHELARKGCVRNLIETKSCTCLGIQKHHVGWLKGISLTDGPATPAGIGESPLGNPDLGLRFWRRYNVTLDFLRQTLYLEKSHWFGREEEADMSGLVFRWKADKIIVSEVRERSPTSPTAQAGLKPDDVLLKIGGKDAAKTRFLELMRVLSRKGQKVPVVYQRNGVQAEVLVALNSWDEKPAQPGFLKESPSKETLASLMHSRGFAFFLKNDPDRAIADFDEALRLVPGKIDYLVCRAQAWREKKDFSKALADYNEAIRQEPKDVALIWARGLISYAQGNLEKALEDFNLCLRLDPKNSMFLKETSRYLGARGNWDEALAKVDEALRLAPKDIEAMVYRGNYLAMLRQTDNALHEYERALAIDPKFAMAYGDRGIMFVNAGKYDRALPDLNKGIELGYRHWAAYLARATVHHHRRDQEKEIADLEAALRLDPENSLAQRGLAWNLATGSIKLRDGRRALRLAQKLCVGTDYKDANALEVLAAAHAESGNYREAVRWQQSAIQIYAASGPNYDRYYVGFQPVELARMRLGSYEKNTALRE